MREHESHSGITVLAVLCAFSVILFLKNNWAETVMRAATVGTLVFAIYAILRWSPSQTGAVSFWLLIPAFLFVALAAWCVVVILRDGATVDRLISLAWLLVLSIFLCAQLVRRHRQGKGDPNSGW